MKIVVLRIYRIANEEHSSRHNAVTSRSCVGFFNFFWSSLAKMFILIHMGPINKNNAKKPSLSLVTSSESTS